MKRGKFVGLVLCISFLVGCATTHVTMPVKAQPRPAPVKLQHQRPVGFWENKQAVVQVIHSFNQLALDATGIPILDANGKLTIKKMMNLGTGGVVDADGWVVTNNHIVEKQPLDLTIYPPAMQPDPPLPPELDKVCTVVADVQNCQEAEVVDTDSENDLALIYVDQHFSHVVKFVDNSELVPGDEIYFWGNVFDFLPPSPLFGHYIGRIGPPYYTGTKFSPPSLPLLLMDINVSPGSSGSPVFDELGRAICVAGAYTHGTNGGRSLGVAIPSPKVLKLLKKHNIPPAPPPVAQKK